MPSQAMRDIIDAFRDQQKATAGQAPPPLEKRRASFAPADQLQPGPPSESGSSCGPGVP